MQIEKEIEIVKRLTGIDDECRIVANEIGWSSRAYLVDNAKIVLKFPRTEQDRQYYTKEVEALQLVKNLKLDVSIPIINWTNDKNDYIGFYGVEGQSIKTKIDQLNKEQKQEVGNRIGNFVKQIHVITDYGNPNIMIVQDEITEFVEKYQKTKGALEKFFDTKELSIIDNLFMKVMPNMMTKLGEDLVFCHGDLTYNNILLDSKNKVGIIDFGDTGLYDRAKDFGGLEDAIIRKSAFEAYGADELLIEKTNFHLTIIPVLDILYFVCKKDDAGIRDCIEKIREKILK